MQGPNNKVYVYVYQFGIVNIWLLFSVLYSNKYLFTYSRFYINVALFFYQPTIYFDYS